MYMYKLWGRGGGRGGGGGTPIPEYGGELPLYWPLFGHFQIPLDPFFMLNSILLLTPSFCRKNQFVSITFSSRDNLS